MLTLIKANLIPLRKIVFLLSLFTLLNCGEKKKKPINPSEVITQATLLDYNELTESERKEMIFKKCCCYPKNWNRGINCIEKEDAFYVKAKIDINLLGAISESETFTLNKIITSNPHSLYGKYINRWEFKDQNGNKICETAKSDGHNDFSLKRSGTIDQIIIGPLPKKPSKMIIKIMDSKFYEGMNPESEINN